MKLRIKDLIDLDIEQIRKIMLKKFRLDFYLNKIITKEDLEDDFLNLDIEKKFGCENELEYIFKEIDINEIKDILRISNLKDRNINIYYYDDYREEGTGRLFVFVDNSGILYIIGYTDDIYDDVTELAIVKNPDDIKSIINSIINEVYVKIRDKIDILDFFK